MELYDNHIQIYISILQVLQSLSRDNHGIFISLVLFETWLCRVSNLQFFKAWQLTPLFSFRTPLFNFQTQTEAILLNVGPKTTFAPGTKAGFLLPPQRSREEPPFLPRPAPPGSAWERLPGTTEKLQFVCAYVWTLSMLSCLQVNLSWGVCHGSSWFCI